MLHLMPEIEQMVDNRVDNSNSPPSGPRRPPPGATRSTFQRQMREDVFGIIHDECRALRQALEEAVIRSAQAQQDTLRRFLKEGKVPEDTSFTSTPSTAWTPGQNGSNLSEPLPNVAVDMRPVKPCSSGITDASLPTIQDDDFSNFHSPTLPEAPFDYEEADQVLDDAAKPTTGGMFQQRAARMAERGHGGNELAEASGWGKKKVNDNQREQQFEKGWDCCHFNRREQLLKIIKSRPFELTTNIVIATNAVFMGWKANVTLGAAIEREPYNSPFMVDFMENFFTLFFAVEWLLRLIVYQKWFFKVEDRKWHLFDTILVMLSLIEIIIKVAAGSLQQTMLLRIFRVARLVRLLKIARYLTFFRELRLMIFGLIASLRSLLWSFVMLALVVYIFSIVFVQAAIAWLQKDDYAGLPEQLRDDYIEWFGSTQISMRTLLVAISGGTDWIQFVDMLEKVSPIYSLIFILYIMLVFHGVLHVIASIFVDSAMNTSKQEKDDLILQEMSNKDSYMTLIQTVLKEADKDGSGTISWDEFQRYLNDSRMTTFFKAIELDVTEARGLYKLLDVDESDEVPIDEFVTGCFRLKGNAKSLDLASLMHENKKVMRVLMKFMSYTEEQFGLLLQKCSQ